VLFARVEARDSIPATLAGGPRSKGSSGTRVFLILNTAILLRHYPVNLLKEFRDALSLVIKLSAPTLKH